MILIIHKIFKMHIHRHNKSLKEISQNIMIPTDYGIINDFSFFLYFIIFKVNVYYFYNWK